MKRRTILHRLFALAVACCLVTGMTEHVRAQRKEASQVVILQEESKTKAKTKQKTSGELQWQEEAETKAPKIEAEPVEEHRRETPQEHDEVRVFIVMKGDSALEEGFSARGISKNEQAQSFSSDTQARQEAVVSDIQRAVGGHPVDIRYQFSMLDNAVSATVRYGDIEQIRAVEGVEEVYLVPQLRLQDQTKAITGQEIMGAGKTWEIGYTGAGQRIAIIDTGIDEDHPSFDPHAFAYGRSLSEGRSGFATAEERLLNTQEISNVFDQLKIAKKTGDISPKALYRNEKIAFAYNYAGENLNVDSNGSDHGTHVAGIAAANQYVPGENSAYQEQPDGVAGIAKDAQLLIMKVFTDDEMAFTDDYMAAIEDALLLDADVVNLSLGGDEPGESGAYSGGEYVDQIFNKLLGSDMVVSIAAGNGGAWADVSSIYHNRAEDVNMNMVGEPGSYTNALTVASAVDLRGSIEEGTQSVTDTVTAEGYQMSEYSSWGVPGDLALKPEITAPGENIYSTVNGGGYGCMSGTSMAAPGIAGISALVLEYIERNQLDVKTGLSRRTLAQSLLMSTAVPLKEKDQEEYSPRKQGSGLANAAAATTTPVYILMGEKEENDGKVKAELGDDPDRSGQYEFAFDVYNLTEEYQYYALDSSILTEELLEGKWIQGSSHKLQPQVEFDSESQVLMYDLNGDQKVDQGDALELLRHVNQSVDSQRVESHQEKFDFNGDGVVNTLDVHRFLKELQAPTINFQEKTLEVKESARVSVKVTLSQADRDYLDGCFENGMYIDGFVYLKGTVNLSIPMLAFYGNWTESSMYEPFNYLEHYNGDGDKDEENVSYSGAGSTNYLNYYSAAEDGAFCYGSNLYLEGGDEKYLPDRNAFSTNSGDRIEYAVYTLIRNAAVVETTISNDKTGKVYARHRERDQQGAYYDIGEGEWKNLHSSSVLDWQGLDKKGKPLPEGTTVRFTVTALPEYYKDQPKQAAEGAKFSVPVTIDNTKPELISMKDGKSGNIEIAIEDNRYTAAVKVYERDQETLLATYGVNQEEPGIPIKLAIKDPKKVFYLKLVDYAGNTASYRVNRTGSADTSVTDGITLDQTKATVIKNNSIRLKASVSPESILDDTVTWSSENPAIATVDENGVVTGIAPGTTRILAVTNARNAAGEQETALCQVTVEEISVSLNGMFRKDDKTYFCSFNTADLSQYKKLSAGKRVYYQAGTLTGDSQMLASASNVDGADLYLIDLKNQYQTTPLGSLAWDPVDLAYSPNTEMVFGVEGTKLHWFESKDLSALDGEIDLGGETAGSNLVGVAYAGASTASGYGLTDWFYLISQTGMLYQVGYSVANNEFVYEDICRKLGSARVSTGEETAYNAICYDASSGYLFWGMYSSDYPLNIRLYAIACDGTKMDGLVTANYLGDFPADVWPVAGLYSAAGTEKTPAVGMEGPRHAEP